MSWQEATSEPAWNKQDDSFYAHSGLERRPPETMSRAKWRRVVVDSIEIRPI